MSLLDVWVNDRNLRTDIGVSGIEVLGLEGWAAGITRTREIVQLSRGRNVKARQVRFQPRNVRMKVFIDPPTLADRDAQIARVLDAFGGDVIELRFSDAPDLVLFGELMSEAVTDFDDAFLVNEVAVSLAIECSDPARYDRTIQTVSFDASDVAPTAVPLGTLAAFGIITISGPSTNPLLNYWTSADVLKASMGFTVALGVADSLAIDTEERTVVHSVSGVESNGLDLHTSGDFFDFDPQDGSLLMGVWPKIAVSSGAAVLAYRRRWK